MSAGDRLFLLGGRVVDPANRVDEPRDVAIEDGRIRAVAPPGSFASEAEGAETIDARGCLVLPGLVDMHVHLREPGYEYRETVATGAAAAVAGGFTSVACMANTKPVNDNGAVTEYIIERARMARLANVFPIGAVSVGLEGRQLAEMGEMRRAGIVAVSDDGMPVANGGLMRRALEYAKMFDIAVIAHEEDPFLVDGGVMNEGVIATRLGLKGSPAAAEECMVARDLSLAALTAGRLHIAHVSTAGTVRLIREAKANGVRVTAEVTPHHLTLNEEATIGYNTNAKMNPPLRTAADVEAVRLGLRDGTIDAVATDHAPHHADEKEIEFDKAHNGILGLETAVPLLLRVAREADIPLARLVEAITVAPSAILGVDRGTLSVGAIADVTVVDPELGWRYAAAEGASKSRNSPFEGWDMNGRAVYTVVGGRVVWTAPRRASGADVQELHGVR